MPRALQKAQPEREPRRRGHNAGLHWAFCGGAIVVGPDWKNVLGSAFLIGAPVGVFMGFEAKKIGEDISWAAIGVIGGLALISLFLLFLTAFMDPGFVPRDPVEDAAEEGHQGMTKEFQVNGYTVNTKWCSTCNHFRPPRCSHCAVCDNCVRKFDHHCPWLGNCIGERNYRFFLTFLFVTTALDCLVFAFCWVRLAYLMRHGDQPNLGVAISREPANIVLIVYTFLAFWFVGGLGGLHVFFTSQNTTTYEHFRSRYNAQGNPYDRGILRNWHEVLCTAVAQRYPERLPGRVVTPHDEDEGYFDGPPAHHHGDARELSQSPSQGAMHGAVSARPAAAATGIVAAGGERSLVRRPSSAVSNRSLDLSSDSEEGSSAISIEGRRTVPMVSAVGNFDLREVLDTGDTDLSDMAEEIKTYHSVLVVDESSTEEHHVYDDVSDTGAAATTAPDADSAGTAIAPRQQSSELPLRRHYDASQASPTKAAEQLASYPIQMNPNGELTSRPSSAGSQATLQHQPSPPAGAASVVPPLRPAAPAARAEAAKADESGRQTNGRRMTENSSLGDGSFNEPLSHRSMFDSDSEYRSVRGGMDSDQESYSSARGEWAHGQDTGREQRPGSGSSPVPRLRTSQVVTSPGAQRSGSSSHEPSPGGPPPAQNTSAQPPPPCPAEGSTGNSESGGNTHDSSTSQQPAAAPNPVPPVKWGTR